MQQLLTPDNANTSAAPAPAERCSAPLVGPNRVTFDRACYCRFDTEGNRTVKYRSQTGALDATAKDVTGYTCGDRNRLIGPMRQPAYGAEPDEMISPAAGTSDSSREEAEAAAANLSARPTDRPAVKIAFVSPHCVVDFTNGAATATLDALVFLQSLGFCCEAFCNSRLDSWDEAVVERVLAERGLRCKASDMRIGSFRGRMIFTLYRGLPVTIFRSASTRGGWRDREEVSAFLTGCNIFLNKKAPRLGLDLRRRSGGAPAAPGRAGAGHPAFV